MNSITNNLNNVHINGGRLDKDEEVVSEQKRVTIPAGSLGEANRQIEHVSVSSSGTVKVKGGEILSPNQYQGIEEASSALQKSQILAGKNTFPAIDKKMSAAGDYAAEVCANEAISNGEQAKKVSSRFEDLSLDIGKSQDALLKQRLASGESTLYDLKNHVMATLNRAKTEVIPGSTVAKTIDLRYATIQNNTDLIKMGKPVDIEYLIAQIMFELDEIRKEAAKHKALEANVMYESQLKSAELTKEAGKERATAAIISGAFSYAGVAAQIGGTLGTSYFSKEKFGGRNGADVKVVQSKQELKMQDKFENKWNTISKAGGEAFTTSGQIGSGVRQQDIAEVEGEAKKYDAYAQSMSSRRDNTAALQDMMLQSIQKALEMMNQLYQIQNQGAGSIIRNMA